MVGSLRRKSSKIQMRHLILVVFILAATTILAGVAWWFRLGPERLWTGITSVLSALASLAAVLGLIRMSERRQPSLVAPYGLRHYEFTDRYQELADVFEEIYSGTSILNIYGPKGVGKSTLLRRVADIINDFVPLEDSDKSINNHTIFGLYFDLVDQVGLAPILGTIRNTIDPDAISSPYEIAKSLNKRVGEKHAVLILDNLNSPALAEPLHKFIREHHSVRPKDIIVLGSVLPMPLYGTVPIRIGISPLPQDVIKDYAEAKGVLASEDDAAVLFRQSEGLPIFLDLLLTQFRSNDVGPLIDLNTRAVIVDQLVPKLDIKTFEILKYLVFRSVFQAASSAKELIEFGFTNVDISIRELEANSLILLNNDGLKVHDIVRDILRDSLFLNDFEMHRKLADNLVSRNLNKEASLHILASGTRKADVDFLCQVIDEELSFRNNSFLLAVGELLSANNLAEFVRESSRELYKRCVYAHLSARLEIGQYPEAARMVKNVTIGISGVSSLSDASIRLDLDFHFLVADLDHLQNRYSQAISFFEQVAERAEVSGYTDLVDKCIWAMAHSMRHQGRNLEESMQLFCSAEKRASNQNNIRLECWAIMGQIGIYLVQNKKENAFKRLELLQVKGAQLPDAVASTWKYTAMWRKINGDIELAHKATIKALSYYNSVGSRLVYNVYFEQAECLRLGKSFAKAKDIYQKVCIYSKENTDRNLQCHTRLGIVLCDLGYTNPSRIIENELVDIMELAKESDTYITELQARLTLECIRTTRNIDNDNIMASLVSHMDSLGLLRETECSRKQSIPSLALMPLILL